MTVGMPYFEFYLPPGAGTTYTSNWHVSPVRGVYRRFVYSVSRAADYEVYLCSLDFNPLACSEATLPPLTSANAVPWTVEFKVVARQGQCDSPRRRQTDRVTTP